MWRGRALCCPIDADVRVCSGLHVHFYKFNVVSSWRKGTLRTNHLESRAKIVEDVKVPRNIYLINE